MQLWFPLLRLCYVLRKLVHTAFLLNYFTVISVFPFINIYKSHARLRTLLLYTGTCMFYKQFCKCNRTVEFSNKLDGLSRCCGSTVNGQFVNACNCWSVPLTAVLSMHIWPCHGTCPVSGCCALLHCPSYPFVKNRLLGIQLLYCIHGDDMTRYTTTTFDFCLTGLFFQRPLQARSDLQRGGGWWWFFLQTRCPSCHPPNIIKALMETDYFNVDAVMCLPYLSLSNS